MENGTIGAVGPWSTDRYDSGHRLSSFLLLEMTAIKVRSSSSSSSSLVSFVSIDDDDVGGGGGGGVVGRRWASPGVPLLIEPFDFPTFVTTLEIPAPIRLTLLLAFDS